MWMLAAQGQARRPSLGDTAAQIDRWDVRLNWGHSLSPWRGPTYWLAFKIKRCIKWRAAAAVGVGLVSATLFLLAQETFLLFKRSITWWDLMFFSAQMEKMNMAVRRITAVWGFNDLPMNQSFVLLKPFLIIVAAIFGIKRLKSRGFAGHRAAWMFTAAARAFQLVSGRTEWFFMFEVTHRCRRAAMLASGEACRHLCLFKVTAVVLSGVCCVMGASCVRSRPVCHSAFHLLSNEWQINSI